MPNKSKGYDSYLSVAVEPALKTALETYARLTGGTPSTVIRQAIFELADREPRLAAALDQARREYPERMAQIIGNVTKLS